ncbi:MAG: hypothetical protein AAFZ07_11525 [Actinomycetota bacterium]
MSLLTCSINGHDISVSPTPGSLLARLHDGAGSITERTTCSYGLNVELDRVAAAGGMRVAAVDELGEVRAIERVDHPFFLGTLYQPQLGSSPDRPHPVFVGLVEAAVRS